MTLRHYTVEEVADLLGFAPRTVYAWIAEGLLPARKFGRGQGTTRISERDLDAYVESRAIRPLPAPPQPSRPSRGRVRRVQTTAA